MNEVKPCPFCGGGAQVLGEEARRDNQRTEDERMVLLSLFGRVARMAGKQAV